MENGSPMITTVPCSAVRPPAISSARVSTPMIAAQRMRIHTGASLFTSLRMEVKFDSTSEPESPEVTKKTMARMVTTMVVMPDHGRLWRNR